MQILRRSKSATAIEINTEVPTAAARAHARPKLGPVWYAFLGLSWAFIARAGCCSGYFKVSGIGTPIRPKASRWVLVGSVSMSVMALVPVNRTWLRVRVARWASRPRKLW